SADYAMVGFVLRKTLSEFGSVARGVCRVDNEGFLQSVTELTKIEKDGAGAKFTDSKGAVKNLSGDEPVSMNMWGFTPGIFNHLRQLFSKFLEQHASDEKAELYIPAVVNQLVNAHRERCQVLRTNDSWFGVTYREDRPLVVEGIRTLIA